MMFLPGVDGSFDLHLLASPQGDAIDRDDVAALHAHIAGRGQINAIAGQRAGDGAGGSDLVHRADRAGRNDMIAVDPMTAVELTAGDTVFQRQLVASGNAQITITVDVSGTYLHVVPGTQFQVSGTIDATADFLGIALCQLVIVVPNGAALMTFADGTEP